MNETECTVKFCKDCLTASGAEVFPIVAHRMQRRGTPDRLIYDISWAGLLEFKGVATRLEIHQAKLIYDLQKRQPGGVFIVRMGNGSGTWLKINSVGVANGKYVEVPVDEFTHDFTKPDGRRFLHKLQQLRYTATCTKTI